jgi:hypothetical protein
MPCRRYRRLLHLNREGELSSEKLRALALHLSGCRACRARLADIVEADRLIRRARSGEPPLAVGGDLAARVLSQRADRSGRSALGFEVTVRSRPLDILLGPAGRYASAAAALLVWTVFFLQGLSLLGRVSDLERIMSTRAVATAGPQVAYPIRSATLRKIPRLGRIAKLLEALPRYGGGMLIPRSIMERYAVLVPGSSVEAALTLGIDAKQLGSFGSLIESYPVIMFDFAGKGD